jgi:sulfur carrier protein
MIIHVNGERRDVTVMARLPDVLDLGPGESVPRGVAVAVDGEVVPRSRHADFELTEGARVEIVTAVQGG